MSKAYKSHEFYLFIIFVLICLVIGSLNPVFYSLGNITKILKSSVEMGILALGFMLVLIMGGIDISFPAIAVASMYIAITLFNAMGAEPSILTAFLLAGGIGALFGIMNGVLIGFLQLPTLIVTLGTMSLIHGGVVVFVGKSWISNIPASLTAFSRANLLSWSTAAGRPEGLHVSVLILVGTAVGIWLLLKYTWVGRSIYAAGGNPGAAKRHGINVPVLTFCVFIFVGFLGGISGMVHASLVRMANPFDIMGTELNVIAAVVLGGASLKGGSGSVIGTMLGVLLINIVNNSLILVGLESYWQKFFIGLILVLSTLITENRGKIHLRPRRAAVSGGSNNEH